MSENAVPRAPGPHHVPADGAWHHTGDQPNPGTIVETRCGRLLLTRPTLIALTWPNCIPCATGRIA